MPNKRGETKRGETKRELNAARLELTGSRRAARVFRAVIVIAIAFTAGFFIRGNEPLMKSLGFDMVSKTQVNPGATVTGNTYDSISARVAEIEGILNTESVDEYDLYTATTTLINGLLTSTGDPYLRYLDAARYETYLEESAETNGVGIGVILAERDSDVYVADVFDGSVAAAAGMETNDVIVSVDGESVAGKAASEVNNAIFKEAGSSVVVTWRRAASSETKKAEDFTATLICSSYNEPNVGKVLEDNVGVVSLKQITQNSASLVSEAVTSLASQGADAFILDLRDCPGGYLTQAVEIANLFIPSGNIVQIVTRGGQSAKAASGATLTEAPLVVLVNSGTAAAAEVIAAALQDSQRATLVGATTMGKGSVQVVRELSFGGALRYTAAWYLSPQGHDINGVGVVPDVAIAATEGADYQREVALATAHSLKR